MCSTSLCICAPFANAPACLSLQVVHVQDGATMDNCAYAKFLELPDAAPVTPAALHVCMDLSYLDRESSLQSYIPDLVVPPVARLDRVGEIVDIFLGALSKDRHHRLTLTQGPSEVGCPGLRCRLLEARGDI